MIVKVQIAVAGSPGAEGSMCLVYAKDSKPLFHGPAPESILFQMHGRPKAYFNATVKAGQIELTEEAPWQDW
jgi:hypothetical protein